MHYHVGSDSVPFAQDGTHIQFRGAQGKTQTLHFHCCMGPAATQADVLKGCGATQLMDAAMAGYHATIFAYGQTGSGKTHTMFGREDSSPVAGTDPDQHEGLSIRCMRHIYDHINRDNSSCRVAVKASCLELYNEGVYDLLNLSSKQLGLKWDPEKGFWVAGLKQVDCPNLEKALHLVRTGVKHRRTSAHALNHESSRSHAIVTMNLEISDTLQSALEHGQLRRSKISFVDLAGSERVKETGAAGGTLKEANSINKSLFTLGKVISALSEPVRPQLTASRQLLLAPFFLHKRGGRNSNSKSEML
jgi:kinesin family member 12